MAITVNEDGSKSGTISERQEAKKKEAKKEAKKK